MAEDESRDLSGESWKSPKGFWRREFVVAGLSALAVAVLAGWLDWIDPVSAMTIVAAIAATAVVQRYFWLKQLDLVATWLWRASSGKNPGPAPAINDSVSDHILRPVQTILRGRQVAQERAAAQEEVIGQLIKVLPDPLLFVNENLIIERMNDAARQAFGITETGIMLGRAIRTPDLMAAIAKAGRQGLGLSTQFRRPQNPDIHYTARIEPVQFSNGRSGMMIAFREDKESVLIERIRSDFIANVSHEIRTPLAAITGIVETLATTARDDPDAREMFLELMAVEASRMTRLVDDLLSLSRIESESHQAIDSRIILGELLDQVISLMQPLARQSCVNLELDIQSPNRQITGDFDQLQQVLCNLVENGIKYGGKGKSLWITAWEIAKAPAAAGVLTDKAVVALAVRDEGPGIESRHLPRLTERFYRVDKARSRQSGGTGLGLAIVKHILRRHGGHLDIQSEPGAGSTFTIYLPASQS